MTLSQLLAAAGVRPLAPADVDPPIEGVSLDSRSIAPGDLFCALPGRDHHGDEFVSEALARGARAVVSSTPRPATFPAAIGWVRVESPRVACGLLARELYGRPDEALQLVGVTGTNGKTTVTYLVESIARAAGRSTARIGTVGYAFGGVERSAARTTPEAPELYRLLAEFRDSGGDLVAMEVSSHALALSRVEGARFRVACLVSFGRDHLDFHGTMEAYFESKARLFVELDPERATAVLPSDDPAGEALARRTRARISSFGRGPAASVRLREETSGRTGSSALLETPQGALRVRTALLGRYNLENVAAAAACALAAGCPPRAVIDGVAALERVPGRLEPIDRGQPFSVLVDYAHTPDALARLVAAARELVSGRLILVFGCGGERDRGKRPEMGRVAAAGAEVVILTTDNPRAEDPRAILKEIEAGVAGVPGGEDRCLVLPDRTEAVRRAVASAHPGDAVLIAGKGHETTQTVGKRVAHLDDRELAREALAAIGFTSGEAAVPALRLSELVAATDGTLLRGDPGIELSSFSIDTRQLRRGGVFFALRGTRTDGHAFLAEALRVGAAAAVVQDDVAPDAPAPPALVRVSDGVAALGRCGVLARRKMSAATILAVTGSAGKTTTKELLAAGLAARRRVHRTQGNLNNHLGVPLTLLACPDDAQVEVIELAMSAPGEIAALARMADPDVGLVTNVRPVHLQYFRTLDDIAAAKGELFGVLRPDAVAAVNIDDEHVRVQSSRHSGPRVTYGRHPSADVVLESLEDRFLPGASLTFRHAGKVRRLELRIAGGHAAQDALAALAAVVAGGFDLDAAVEAMSQVEAGRGRGRVLRLAQNVLVVDDTYNSNPAALSSVLRTLGSSHPSGRKVLVMGDMLELGPDETSFHRDAGRQAASAGVQMFVGVGPLSRAAAEAARKAGVAEVHHEHDAAEAAREMPRRVRPGDLIVVKGSRGVHLEQVVEALVGALVEAH